MPHALDTDASYTYHTTKIDAPYTALGVRAIRKPLGPLVCPADGVVPGRVAHRLPGAVALHVVHPGDLDGAHSARRPQQQPCYTYARRPVGDLWTAQMEAPQKLPENTAARRCT